MFPGSDPFPITYEGKPYHTKRSVSHKVLYVTTSKIARNLISAVGIVETPYPGENNRLIEDMARRDHVKHLERLKGYYMKTI